MSSQVATTKLEDALREELVKSGDTQMLEIWDKSVKGPRPFNTLLTYLRTRKKLNQTELARRFSTFGTPSYINMLERGERNIDLNKVADLAHALDVDPGWLEKRWLYHYYPDVYKRWFGSIPRDPDTDTTIVPASTELKVNLSEEDFDLVSKLSRLPGRKRFVVRAVVNELYQDSRSQVRINEPANRTRKSKKSAEAPEGKPEDVAV